MEQKQSKKKAGVVIIALILVIAAAAAALLFIRFGGKNTGKDNEKTIETQAQTEYTITPCDEEDAEIFRGALVGTWSSFTADGIAYTYTFDEDGAVRYKKDNENASDYTYTFEDGLFTISNGEKKFVYLCSKDAVGMIASLQHGALMQLYSDQSESIPDFNGCVYIADDFMYLGTACLCRDDRLSGFDNKTLEGGWLGAAGDTIDFASDGSYTYVDEGETTTGSYTVDFDKELLTLTRVSTTTDYDSDEWGLDGRVLHIGKQYYFKVA